MKEIAIISMWLFVFVLFCSLTTATILTFVEQIKAQKINKELNLLLKQELEKIINDIEQDKNKEDDK